MDSRGLVTWVRLSTAAGESVTFTSAEDLPMRMVVRQRDDEPDDIAWGFSPRVLPRQREFEVSLAMLYPISDFEPVRLRAAAAQVHRLVHGEDGDRFSELSLESDAVLPDGRFGTLTAPRLVPAPADQRREPAEPGMWAVTLLRAELAPSADGNAFHYTVHPSPSRSA